MLPLIPWYMDLGARGKSSYRDCPIEIKEEISFFLDHGWVVLRNSVPASSVNDATHSFYDHKSRYSSIYSKYSDSHGFQRRIVNLHMAIDDFKRIYTRNSKALKIQDYLFGSPSICFTSLTFESGSEQSIHRDSPYFVTNPEYYYLGVWVALEEVDEKNGALQLYDGGHLLQEPDRYEIFKNYYNDGDSINPHDSRLWDHYQQETVRMCKSRMLNLIQVPMSPGDTLIWHPHLPHGGSEITEKHRSRLSIVNHVIPAGTPVHGMDVFYGQNQPLDCANYSYADFEGRQFLIHQNIDFAHRDPIAYDQFR